MVTTETMRRRLAFGVHLVSPRGAPRHKSHLCRQRRNSDRFVLPDAEDQEELEGIFKVDGLGKQSEYLGAAR
jgi:hypothetical protein